MLRLYSYWRSSASYRVRLALEMKGLSYDYQPVHLTQGGGAQFSAEYRGINPQSRVPALQTDAGVLTQSMAILEWLEETYPQPPLLPADAAGRARVRALCMIMVADVQPLQNISVSRYLHKELDIDEPRIKAFVRHWVERGLAAFEAHLAAGGTGRFCHGDQLSLADTCLVPQCFAARRYDVDPASYPHLARVEAELQMLEPVRRAAPNRQPDAEG
jgi:maleylacetoacetate isomerase